MGNKVTRRNEYIGKKTGVTLTEENRKILYNVLDSD